MATPKPLSYPSLMCIIPYLEPNLRLRLSSCIPSFQVLEKIVPLKLDYLCLNSFTITVNEIEYRLSVVKDNEEDNGYQYDFDKFGIQDSLSETKVLPGDVVVSKAKEMNEELFHAALRRDERKLEILLEERKRLNASNVPMTLSLANIEIERLEKKVIPYRNRRNNILPDYKMFIQMTVFFRNHAQFQKRMAYNFKLYEVMKNFTGQFLGGRKDFIEVKRLEIYPKSQILRLPQNLKLKIQNLKIDVNALKIIKALEPILDESSFPLALVEINFLCDPWIETFAQLRSQRVHIKHDLVSSQNFIDLIQSWLVNGQELGTWYSFGISHFDKFELLVILLDIMGRENSVTETGEVMGWGISMFPRCVTLPINHHSKLVASVEEAENHDYEMTACDGTPWIFNMKVLEI